jgi:cytochrome P450
VSEGGIDFDPRRDEVKQCPFPHYAQLREQEPIHRMDGERVGRPGRDVYAVSTHDLVVQVLADWRTYSSKVGSPGALPPAHLVPKLREIAEAGYERPPTMLTADPPVHTRYRRLVSKAFTPRRVAELAPVIEAILEDLCDAMDAQVAAGANEIDAVPALCVPIPTRTVAAALGVPQERYADFKRWADGSVATIGTDLDDEGWLAAARVVVELQQYFAAELADRQANPRDDLLTDLTRARLTPEETAEEDLAGAQAEALSMGEMISIVQQLQVAGSETTASLIADAIVMLHERPDEWERLRADPSRSGAIVEEVLRLASPNQGMYRQVTVDTELGGVSLAAGSTLWIMFGSANRDEHAFEQADTLNPDRPHVAQHLAFGRGPHYCIGAPLARLEATIALTTLARRYRRIEVIDPTSLRYGSSSILRGLRSLPVRLQRA